MRTRRRWNRWPGRVLVELNGVGGVVAVGGFAIAIAGWTVLSGLPSTILMLVGIVITAGAVLYALWRSFPPALRRLQDVAGMSFSVGELEDFDPVPIRLAIVGPTRAGKTTLLNRLSLKPKAQERTQVVTASIIALSVAPTSYIALLDGGGEKYSQQFKIAEAADCLLVVLDHNNSETDTAVDPGRLEKNAEFLQQIRDHLREVGRDKKRWIEILMNKRDLWERGTKKQRESIEKFCREQMQKFTDGQYCEQSESHVHSNEIGDDIARLMSKVVGISSLQSNV